MAGGGIHDQLGGGFHRYSVDATWTVPHFEKMLYDNALLARAYLHGWLLAPASARLLRGLPRHARLARCARCAAPRAASTAALDADSEGAEGRFYVWTVAELEEALGRGRRAAIAWLGVTEQGNFTDPHEPLPGMNVLTDRGRSGPTPDEPTRRAHPRAASGGARTAHAPGARRQAPDQLERPDDHRARGRAARRWRARSPATLDAAAPAPSSS